jgi:holo-[acyl-carrier protein] synthase
MSIASIGVDLCDIPRLSKLIGEHGERFLGKVYTAGEIDYCRNKVKNLTSFAGRFAAKEALFKALGTGLRSGMNWKDVEVVNDELGKPHFKFYGEIARIIGNRNVMLSLAHTDENAVAFVVIEGDPF